MENLKLEIVTQFSSFGIYFILFVTFMSSHLFVESVFTAEPLSNQSFRTSRKPTVYCIEKVQFCFNRFHEN